MTLIPFVSHTAYKVIFLTKVKEYYFSEKKIGDTVEPRYNEPLKTKSSVKKRFSLPQKK